MMKSCLHAMLILVGAMFFAAPLSSAAQDKTPPENIATLKYDERLWEQNLLDLLAQGTKIVPVETEFEIALPPENDSAQTTAELDFLENLAQTKRTSAVLGMIQFENANVPIADIFSNGGYFDRVNNAKTYDMILMADAEITYFILKSKKHFLRPRPNTLRPSLATAIPNPPHPAYVSGHGAQSWLTGLVLSYMDEPNKDSYMKFAKSVGFRREIAGVHYPSDAVAGRKLAEQLFAKLMENKAFAKKMDDAKLSYVKPDFSKAYVVTEFDDEKQ